MERGCFVATVMSPTTLQRTPVFLYSARYFYIIVITFVFSRHIFIKLSNVKFHDSLSIGNCADTDGQTDVINLMGSFRDCAKARKNQSARK
jgi:hypothetical protein